MKTNTYLQLDFVVVVVGGGGFFGGRGYIIPAGNYGLFRLDTKCIKECAMDVTLPKCIELNCKHAFVCLRYDTCN